MADEETKTTDSGTPDTNPDTNQIEINQTDQIDQIIEKLLGRIDLPGDKDIDRTPLEFQNLPDTHNQNEPLAEPNLADLLQSGPELERTHAPELRTDKQRRITSTDLGKLYKELNISMTGGQISNDEPVFGEDLTQEPEKTPEAFEELQDLLDDLENETELPSTIQTNAPIQDDSIQDDSLEKTLTDLDARFQDPSIPTPTIQDTTDIQSISETPDNAPVFEDLEDYIQQGEELNKAETNAPTPYSDEDFTTEPFTTDDSYPEIPDDPAEHLPELESLADLDLEDIKELDHTDLHEDTHEEPLDMESIPDHIDDTFTPPQDTQLHQGAPHELSEEELLATFTDQATSPQAGKVAHELMQEFSPLEESTQSPHKKQAEQTYSDADATSNVFQSQQEPETPQTTTTFEMTDAEVQLVQENLAKFPSALSQIAIQVIVEERLPQDKMKAFVQMICKGESLAEVTHFLEHEFHINIPIHTTHTHQKSSRSSGLLFKAAMITIVLLLGASALWIGMVQPYLEQEAIYKQGLDNLRQGEHSYQDALQALHSAKDGTIDPQWAHKYIEELLSQNTPVSLYFAHNILLGKQLSNDTWLKDYQTFVTRRDPGQENTDGFYDSLVLQKPLLEIDPESPETRINIGRTFKNKAYYATKFKKDPKEVNYYFSEAFKQGYTVLLALDPENENYSGMLAKSYIEWAELISKYSKEDAARHFKSAREIYAGFGETPAGLYGLLRLSLAQFTVGTQDRKQRKLLEQQIFSLIHFIERSSFDSTDMDHEVLRNYAMYVSDVKKDPEKAKVILHTILQNGYFDPQSYYYLGNIYEKQSVTHKALELYIKGLYAYYYKYVGPEQFHQFVQEIKNPEGQEVETFQAETLRVILFIQKDMNIQHHETQSNLFLHIALSYLDFVNTFRNTIKQEAEQKEQYMKAVKQNLHLSLEKNPYNINTLKTFGNLAYAQALDFDVEGLGKELVGQGHSSVNHLLADEYFQESQSYYAKLLQASIHGVRESKASLLEQYLIQALKDNEIDAKTLYQLAYTYYHFKHYDSALQILHAFQSYPKYKFHPTINFALGNTYVLSGKRSDAKRYFENIIEVYENRIARYYFTPDPSNPKHNEIFAKLAAAYNNLGVIYYLEFEQTQESSLRKQALYHYYRASEYMSKLNTDRHLHTEQISRNLLFENITYAETNAIHIRNRKATHPQTRLQSPIHINQMIIDTIEPYLTQDSTY